MEERNGFVSMVLVIVMGCMDVAVAVVMKRKMIEYSEIEYLLDKANGEHGTKESLCLFCNAKKYDSKVGIIHKPLCIIMRLREEIRNEH